MLRSKILTLCSYSTFRLLSGYDCPFSFSTFRFASHEFRLFIYASSVDGLFELVTALKSFTIKNSQRICIWHFFFFFFNFYMFCPNAFYPQPLMRIQFLGNAHIPIGCDTTRQCILWLIIFIFVFKRHPVFINKANGIECQLETITDIYSAWWDKMEYVHVKNE